LIFRVFAFGVYDYGKMPLRYFMEFPADIITYALAAGGYMVYRDWIRSREIESALAIARLDGLTRQLQPHFLFNALNAVSGLMYEDVDRADLMLDRIILCRSENAHTLRLMTRFPSKTKVCPLRAHKTS